MVIEKITHRTPFMRNFKCVNCANKVRTDDVGPFTDGNPLGVLRVEAFCPICDHGGELYSL